MVGSGDVRWYRPRTIQFWSLGLYLTVGTMYGHNLVTAARTTRPAHQALPWQKACPQSGRGVVSLPLASNHIVSR